MYGYSQKQYTRKNPCTIVLINLISPRIDYASYARSHIDLGPFADDVDGIHFKMSSETRDANYPKHYTAFGILTRLFVKTCRDIEKDAQIVYTDRWTQTLFTTA